MKRKRNTMILERRMNYVLLFFLIAMAALLARLFMLQIVQHREYLVLAAQQHRLVEEIMPERGAIFAKSRGDELIPLAMNRTFGNVAVSPRDLKDPSSVAVILGQILDIKKEEILPKLLKQNDPYEVIAKKIEPSQKEEIEKRKIKGVFVEEEKRHVYPHKTLAAHVLGFVNQEAEGKYGLERIYERDLTGERGMLEGVKDAAGFWIALGRKIVRPSRNGASLVLTIDYNIQLKAEEALAKAREKWKAASGSILVTEPGTGKILALAALPVFDPNFYAKEKDLSVFLNPLVESRYELGSVLKPLTMASGLEEGVVYPETTYVDEGAVKVRGYTIRNFDLNAHGKQTMTQILEKSLNTGAAYVAKLLGMHRQEEYLRRFGLDGKTGIDLPGEVGGDLSNLKTGREIEFYTASFGQGIAITPLQLASAIGAIANGGTLMKPYVVERIIDDAGNTTVRSPEARRRVIATSTAEMVTKMLVSAVRSGFENRASVKGYFVAGKTGTAQIPRSDGRGYSDDVIHTFVGYAPAFRPRFLILLKLDKPQGNRFAANTLTSAFHDLAEFILNYYEIPPDER